MSKTKDYIVEEMNKGNDVLHPEYHDSGYYDQYKAVDTVDVKLAVFALWLKNYECDCGSGGSGLLEDKLNVAKEETISCIGDMLQEVLSMNHKQIKVELDK